MPDYLLEIGCEELPASHVPEAQERLRSLMAGSLEQNNLPFKEIGTMGTPRRLVAIVRGLQPMQETTSKKVKGPPVKSSFDASGKALPPAAGFAQKQGVSVDALDREEIGGVTYLVANLTVPGKPAAEVLREVVPQVVDQISGERLMRWGSSDFKFSRPIRWLVSLLDGQEVPVCVNEVKSGRQSVGHRILASNPVSIASAGSYVDDLRKACVLVEPGERKSMIERAVAAVAGQVKGSARQLEGSLIEEVVNITEWPSAVLGQFEDQFLDLPDRLIETIMVHHQRYFPVEKQGGDGASALLPYFVAVANNDRPDARPWIKKGNERVLRARLADGRFFYFDDQKTPLSERRHGLSQLSYQEGLGSYLDKQERLTAAARHLAHTLELEARVSVPLERALEICKLDLVTNLVRELPELQGYVGAWYAEGEGQPPDVVAAIASHYSPRSNDDTIPEDRVGQLASLVDKVDNLVSMFALGKRPSGSSDPYALRRQAQGAVDILVDGLSDLKVNVPDLARLLLAALKPWLDKDKRKSDPEKGLADLLEFLTQRLRIKLLEMGVRREVVDAVLAAGDPLADVPDVVVRCRCLDRLASTDAGLLTVKAAVRVGNILAADSPHTTDSKLFSEPAEKELHNAFEKDVVAAWEKGGVCRKPSGEEEYKSLLGCLGKIAAPVDLFFDQVMVNDPDKGKRDNRHGLLYGIDRYFKMVADFTKLQPLLP